MLNAMFASHTTPFRSGSTFDNWRSLDLQFLIHPAHLRRTEHVVMRDVDGVDNRLDLAAPVVEKLCEAREFRRHVHGLPDEALKEFWKVWPVVNDFSCQKPAPGKLFSEIVVLHSVIPSVMRLIRIQKCARDAAPVKKYIYFNMLAAVKRGCQHARPAGSDSLPEYRKNFSFSPVDASARAS